ncbi:glycosyltransferase [Paracoccus stylophorae]|uniref:Glycosyltransferase n=1 Tax=Paracoccus stylophorae TaxID=659350 RepID=A0ABY7SUF5_9RHOB|nr:glycosyltransferase [Paracoccus stylophorae]WCR10679.1 glycosyltransferase [Paracoccus stylophorae]
MKRRLATVWGAVILALWVPLFGVAICLAILILQLALMVMRPIIARLPARAIDNPGPASPPWFSVHVATHAEPPDMVIRTLRALLDQDWPDRAFEIVVMDNNTRDPALWTPVQAFCAAHPGRITFLHRKNVQAAKAGALNIALAHTAPAATHIVTVDADYVVRRDFLSTAAAALRRTGADYVQFPQSYADTEATAPGVNAELEEYFRTDATNADEADAVLLTGTLCVIARDALIRAGGWQGVTTTEDAEMGVRLCDTGHVGRFVNRIVGQGLLPMSLKDLEKQRYRWCSGNFQTLLRHSGTILGGARRLGLQKRLAIVSQLTAWFNLTLIPCLLLLVWLAMGRESTAEVVLAASVIVLSLCDIVLRVVGRGLRDGLGWPVICHALACRIALAPRSAMATFDALCGKRLAFVVTDKWGKVAGRAHVAHGLLCAASLAALAALHPVQPLVVVALLTLALPLPAAVITDRSLRSYRASCLAAREVAA